MDDNPPIVDDPDDARARLKARLTTFNTTKIIPPPAVIKPRGVFHKDRRTSLAKAGGRVVMPHTNVRPIMIGNRKRSIVEEVIGENKVKKNNKAVGGRQERKGSGGKWVDPMDFIDFILNHDSLTEEFCYMTKTGNGGAYDLQIVPFSQINPYDYYTISLRGVTSFRRGSIEFTPLHVWQRDQALYRKVMNIPFFAKYRKWKLYTVWRSAVIRQRMRKCRSVLSKSLFILDPTLRSALLAVRKECVKVSNWSLLDLTTPTSKPGTKMAVTGHESYRGYGGRGAGKRGTRFKWQIDDSQSVQIRGAGGCCCRIEDFANAQEACRDKLSKDLEGVWSGLKDTVMMACARSLSDFLVANGFHQPADLRSVLEVLEEGKDEGESKGGMESIGQGR